MGIRRYHVEKDAVSGEEHIIDNTIPIAKLKDSEIQFGKVSLTLPFAAAGVETVSASVSFPKSFPTGKIPTVIVVPRTILAITFRVTGESETGFTLEASDNVGTDYTTSQTFDIAYIAIVR